MEKLELKHLAPYLPYSLTVGKRFESEFFIEELDMYNMPSLFNDPKKKPILRPLTDLKTITVDGEIRGYKPHVIKAELGVGKLSYTMFEFLLRMHFDVFGLIEKGLAIDINDLEK